MIEKKANDLLKEKHTENSNVNMVYEILFVIVLYRTELKNSLTFKSIGLSVKSFDANLRVDLLVCDNSPISQDLNTSTINNDHFNIYYLHDPSNPGISLSYNRAAEFALVKGKKWMLVMDQDTEFPVNALNEYIQSISHLPNFPIYAPKVFDNNGIMLSPCAYKFYRGYPLIDIAPGVNKVMFRNVINSGLLLNLDAYRKVNGYDENVWLYFSDFVFFNKLKNYYKYFVIINCHLIHELSSSDYSNYDFAIKRFKYYCEGAKAASECNDNLSSYISYRLTVGMRGLLMSWRFKKLSFFKLFLHTFS